MTTVGWIGLGAMGAPMATCVARAGYAMAAFDVDPQKAVALAPEGVKPVDTVAAAADGADVLVLMVATAQQAESVLYGDGNAAAVLKPGAVVMLMATVGPAAVEDWAKRLEPAGVEIVDAPVSGGASPRRTGRPAHHGQRLGGFARRRAAAVGRHGSQCPRRRLATR